MFDLNFTIIYNFYYGRNIEGRLSHFSIKLTNFISIADVTFKVAFLLPIIIDENVVVSTIAAVVAEVLMQICVEGKYFCQLSICQCQ